MRKQQHIRIINIAYIVIKLNVRLLFKALAHNEYLPQKYRQRAILELSKFNIKNSRVRNRCIITSRTNGVNGVFKLARSKFHTIAGTGMLPGVRKSSW